MSLQTTEINTEYGRHLSKMINDPMDELGNTIIFYSILIKDFGFSLFLISQGADLNLRNRYGVSPMDLIQNEKDFPDFKCLNNSIYSACLSVNNGDNGDMSELNTAFNNTHLFTQKEPWTPIVGAIYSANEKLVRKLIDRGINVNMRIMGKSLLMIAALLQRNNIVALLLQRGAIVDINPEIWLIQGILQLKRKCLNSNLWLDRKDGSVLLTKRENDNIDILLKMLSLKKDTKSKIMEAKMGLDYSMLEFPDLEVLVSHTLVGYDTVLDKSWIDMLQFTVKLADAVIQKQKNLYASITVGILNSYAQFSKNIEIYINVTCFN